MERQDERTFTLRSSAFSNGEAIPLRFSCDGDDVSPPLEWESPPEGTRGYALVVEDPDAPDGTFTHWILFNLPASVTSLPERASDIGTSGRNDFEEPGYGGPCPPPHHGQHRYYFRLHALDTESLDLSEDATRSELDAAIEGHALATAELMGTFARED